MTRSLRHSLGCICTKVPQRRPSDGLSIRNTSRAWKDLLRHFCLHFPDSNKIRTSCLHKIQDSTWILPNHTFQGLSLRLLQMDIQNKQYLMEPFERDESASESKQVNLKFLLLSAASSRLWEFFQRTFAIYSTSICSQRAYIANSTSLSWMAPGS